MLSPISPKTNTYYTVLYRIIPYYASKHIFSLGLMGLINYVRNGISALIMVING